MHGVCCICVSRRNIAFYEFEAEVLVSVVDLLLRYLTGGKHNQSKDAGDVFKPRSQHSRFRRSVRAEVGHLLLGLQDAGQSLHG